MHVKLLHVFSNLFLIKERININNAAMYDYVNVEIEVRALISVK
jgi:hypothetical protein